MNMLATIKARKGPVLSTADKAEIPSLRDISPEYGRLVDQRAALVSELAPLHARMVEIACRGAELQADAMSRPIPTDRDKSVAVLLGDAPPEPPAMDTALASLDEINARKNVVEAAIALLDDRISKSRLAASKIACEQLAGRHKHLVIAICDRLLALYEAAALYDDFREQLTQENIAFGELYPLPASFVSLHDRGSPAARYLREAAEHGFIPHSRIPESIR